MTQREEVARTERTIVRKLTLEDADFIYELMRSEGFLKYIGDRNIQTLEDAENYIRDSFLGAYQDRKFGYYLVENEQGERAGIAGFLKKEHLENEDFGFAFLPSKMRKGYAYEASVALLKFGQESFKFKVLDAETLSANVASRKLLEKLGFEEIQELESTEEQGETLLFRLNLY